MPLPLLLVLQAAATWYMVGVIWMVQLIHYPLMGRVGASEFVGYERAHTQWMSLVVGPGMLVEVVTAAYWLLAVQGRKDEAVFAWIGAGLIAVIWGSTFFVQVPLHEKLSQGFDAAALALLVGTNWIRTFAWTARGVLMAWMVWRMLPKE
jgi:hypothetical protein